MSFAEERERDDLPELLTFEFKQTLKRWIRRRIDSAFYRLVDVEDLQNAVEFELIQHLPSVDWRKMKLQEIAALSRKIAEHNIISAIAYEKRTKRLLPKLGVVRVDPESLVDPHSNCDPSEAIELEDFLERLDGLLSKENRQVLEYKRMGWGNDQIATELGCTLRSVQTRLKIIGELTLRELKRIESAHQTPAIPGERKNPVFSLVDKC